MHEVINAMKKQVLRRGTRPCSFTTDDQRWSDDDEDDDDDDPDDDCYGDGEERINERR